MQESLVRDRQRPPIKERILQFRFPLDNRQLRLGVGCAWLGIDPARADDDLQLLLRCYQEGLRFFDTSHKYHASERLVGEFIQRIDRASIFLSTKSPFLYQEHGKNAFIAFRDSFFESFERLRTDHIDLYQIHDTENISVCMDEVIPFLREQRDRGLIDYIGLGTRSQRTQNEAIISGAIDASLNYLTYSLIKQSALSTLELSHHYGTAFINASVLHFGAFTEQEPAMHLGLSRWARRMYRNATAMRQLCEQMGIDIIAAALQISLFNPRIDMTLNGIGRLSDLESTLSALRTPIYPDQWVRIFELQAADPFLTIEDEYET